MKIVLFKAFQIKNYKSFVDSGICPVQGGVTILAGQNESGKTNILKALEKINDASPVFSEEEYSFSNNDVSPEIIYWFMLSDSEEKKIFETTECELAGNEVVVEVKNKSKKICFRIENREPDETLSKKISEELSPLVPKFILYQTTVDDIPDIFTASEVNSKKAIKRLSSYLNADFTKIFNNTNQQSQKRDTQKLSRTISQDFAEKYKQKNVSLEFDINAGIMSIYVHDVKPNTDEQGYPFKLSQRSMGLKWYLNFYIALKGENLKNGDIILVDEPGMYLHPKAQQEMRVILNSETKKNQIIYTTHSPYLIDSENISQIRLVEKREINNEDGFNEISEIKEKIHRSNNIDTIKPIIDAIGYSLGSELNHVNKKVLICEGVSDYYYIKTLEKIFGELGCGITHANGCGNIGKINSLYLGLGIQDIYALFDSDRQGNKEMNKLIESGAFDKNNVITVGETKDDEKAIEDIFDREWFLKNILEYKDEDIEKADALLSKEVNKKIGASKYVFAKKVYEMSANGTFEADKAFSENAKNLFDRLFKALIDNEETEYDFEK